MAFDIIEGLGRGTINLERALETGLFFESSSREYKKGAGGLR